MNKQSIELTDKEFELLFRAVVLTSGIYGILKDSTGEKKYKINSEKVDELEKKLLSYVSSFGLAEITDQEEGQIYVDELFRTDVLDDLFAYGDLETHDNLAKELGRRDLYEKSTPKEIYELKKKKYVGVEMYPYEEKYWKEFEKYGYDRLYVDETRKTREK